MELELEFVRTCVVFRITSASCYSSFRLVNKSLTLSLLTLCVLHLVAAVGYFFGMEDTVKALEEKVAKLKANLGKKSESTVGTSGNSPISSPENLLHIKPESFCATSGESWVVWIWKVSQPLTSGVLSFKPK